MGRPGTALKATGLVALLLAAALALVYGSMRLGWWDTDPAAVRARYAGPPSVFLRVDGVALHVRDEGRGPVVLMLHGSIANLHEWDPVAARLKARFRVVRLDWPPYGVSGPDPAGVYTTQRASDLVAGLVARMGLRDVNLVATSNGVNVALQYAADHPAGLRSLALSIPPLERPSHARKSNPVIGWLGAFHKAWLPDYHPRVWYRLIVADTVAPGFPPPPELVDMMYEADNQPGAEARQRAYVASTASAFRTGQAAAIAARVHAPVLLQWCARDTVISQSAQATIARFTHAPVQLVVYPDVGHFPMWEAPDRFTRDLAAFLDRVTAPAAQAATEVRS